MKHSKKCPECGGTEIYTQRLIGSSASNAFLYKADRSLFDFPKFDAFCCANCGCYQLFVGEEWLPEISEKWSRHE
jgi:hypothetical protein